MKQNWILSNSCQDIDQSGGLAIIYIPKATLLTLKTTNERLESLQGGMNGCGEREPERMKVTKVILPEHRKWETQGKSEIVKEGSSVMSCSFPANWTLTCLEFRK